MRRLLGRETRRALIDLLFHLPTGAIDRRARPKLQRRPARHRGHRRGHRRASTARRRRNRPRAPYRIYASDETGDLTLTYLQRAPGLSREAPAGRRDALRLRHRRVLRRHAADGASRPRGRRGGLRQAAAGRAGLSADRRAWRSAMCARRSTARWRDCPTLPEWQDEAWVARERLPAFARRAARAAPPGRARRRRAGKPGLDAARL